MSRKGIQVLLHELQDLLGNRPSVRISIHTLLGTEGVNQLEPGVKDFVALIENVSSVRMNPFLKTQPLGCTILHEQLAELTILNMIAYSHRFAQHGRNDRLVYFLKCRYGICHKLPLV